jgi:hypothetical protein
MDYRLGLNFNRGWNNLPADGAKGIDGYIGDIPVSIKPHTYRVKAALPEHITTIIIYYKKVDDGIEVDYEEIL